MEILSPLNQSILQWDKTCNDESVDNFDLALSINGGLETADGYMSVDHTFHTPSFGDEEFDIPPINLQPTTPGSDTNSSDVYGSTQPLSHQEQQPSQQQQQNGHQQHMMSPPPQLQSPAPCSQQAGVGPVMTAVTTTPSPPAVMTSYSSGSPPQHAGHPQYCPPPGDMYMLQISPGSMMPPQSVQFQVQQYSLPNGYSNGPMQQQQHQLHMDPPQQQQQHQVPQQHHMQNLMHHHPHHHHQLQQQQQQHHHLQHHQLLPPSPMLALQLAGPPRPRPGSVGSSPPVSNHTSPGLETSEDSDDSGHLSQLMCGIKRPSPEPVERPPSVGKPVKKPKVQKKKKKRDPNEPQKPVSAYALFFRDTQAAIKGQNPNASFGEVSKIVASMWDGLDIDHKNVYKKKTEAAKKEYLKALAAYRASLVSKAANDQSDNIYGGGAPNVTTPTSMSSPMTSQALSPLQKKSPLLTSLMEGTPVSSLQNMTQPQPLIMGQSPMNSVHHQHMLQQQQQQHLPPHSSAPTHQMLHQMLSPNGGQQMLHMGSPPPIMMPHHTMNGMQGLPLNATPSNNSLSYTTNMSPQLSHQQGQQGMMCNSPLQSCPRNGGENPQEWEREFCNNDCVVSHCRDVFTTWVASRPPQNSYASVK